MNIETALIELIGEAGEKLHTARSRNDQVALDVRMWLREQIILIQKSIELLQKSIVSLATDNINIVIPGYTHLQLSLIHI